MKINNFDSVKIYDRSLNKGLVRSFLQLAAETYMPKNSSLLQDCQISKNVHYFRSLFFLIAA